MGYEITGRQVIARLEENGLPYGVLALQNGVSLIVTQRGGRILGPFLSSDSASIFWINGAFAQSRAFQQFLESDDWNLGGDRIWISPELQYFVRERADFEGTYDLPEEIDPGDYRLERAGDDQWRLSLDMTLELFNFASGRKELHLERLIRPVDDPLRTLSNYRALTEGVVYAGYEQVATLSERVQDGVLSETWSLIQLNAGGELLIPASPEVEFVDYFEPIGESLQTFHGDHVRLKITGNRRYKVGYKAAHVFGRVGYLNHLDDGRACLLVRNFFNNPSAPYVEEPPELPGFRGQSIHVYNDDGELGGFGELECQAQAIGGETGRSASTDQLILWLYVGATAKVETIARHLLGIRI